MKAAGAPTPWPKPTTIDRKSTRLNSSHTVTSYAVFCLKKKMLRPHVGTIGVHGEGKVAPGHADAGGPHGHLVPAGGDLDLHTPVAVLQGLVGASRERIG